MAATTPTGMPVLHSGSAGTVSARRVGTPRIELFGPPSGSDDALSGGTTVRILLRSTSWCDRAGRAAHRSHNPTGAAPEDSLAVSTRPTGRVRRVDDATEEFDSLLIGDCQRRRIAVDDQDGALRVLSAGGADRPQE